MTRTRGDFAPLLVCTLGGQALGTMATMTLPAVAPAVSASYGVASSVIGYQISLLAAAMLFSLVFGANLSARWGATRVQQTGLALLVCGMLIALGPHIAFFFASAVALGLGYGLMTPSSSHLLMRHTTPERRNLIFSVKQTGVPLGGIGASLIAPALATAFSWRWALVVNTVSMLALIVLLERHRRTWDDDRKPGSPLVVNPLEGLAMIWRHRALRYLSLSGAFLVVPQFAISTFVVVFFVEEAGYTLVAAGVVLTASQVGGVAGRVFWGWVADLTKNCYTALCVLCAVMAVAAAACLAISPGWPLAAACALFFVFGLTASGWNGAFLAEVARVAPLSQVSRATGGSLFYVNVGKLIGPIAIANAHTLTGSYAIAFALLVIAAAAAAAFLVAARAEPARSLHFRA